MFNGFILLGELQHNYSVLPLFCDLFSIREIRKQFPQCLLDGFSTKGIDHNKIKKAKNLYLGALCGHKAKVA